MRRGRRILLAAAGAVAGLGLVVGGLVSPTESREPTRLPDVATLQMGVCPVQGASGDLVGGTTPGARVRMLAESTAVSATAPITAPVIVTQNQASGVLPPGVNLSSPTGRSFAACSEPASTSAVQVPDPSVADLLLVNPDKTQAVVNLALSSVNGSLTTAGSRGLTIPPGQVRVVPISVLAPGSDPVTVVQTATQGRVVMVSRTIDGAVDQLAATQPAAEVVLPGIVAGSTSTRLVLGNPGETRTQVTVKAMNGRGEYVPVGTENVTVDAQSSVQLDLTGALEGEATSLHLTADQPIVATAEVRVGNDTAMVGSAPLAPVITDIPASGVVQVANPNPQPVTVQVTSGSRTTRVRVPASGAAGTVVQAGQVVTLSSGLPIAAASIIANSGVAVQPLRGAVQQSNEVQIDQDPRLG
ncbi:DUF5719 family protein [Aestuariimicrobium kwangyangense]|uniref:DUF5719 family protein n=1 Tax=Aestuariimicrobium kwangyangense TaxID=396389 RepID=UPI0003B47621|nr:DUF5719 family protein [Aestuariimicrobium kwangyangense]